MTAAEKRSVTRPQRRAGVRPPEGLRQDGVEVLYELGQSLSEGFERIERRPFQQRRATSRMVDMSTLPVTTLKFAMRQSVPWRSYCSGFSNLSFEVSQYRLLCGRRS